MPIENLLTKIIVHANKLPYDKQKELLKILQSWASEADSGNQNVSPAATAESSTISSDSSSFLDNQTASNQKTIYEPKTTEETQSEIKIESVSSPISAVQAKDDVVLNIIEDRAYERKDVSIPIDFVSAGQLYKEITKNMSAGGLFIRTKKQNKFKKNQKISMVFVLSEDKKPFKLTGKIIRIDPEGIAVQFHNISPFECVAIEEELSSI